MSVESLGFAAATSEGTTITAPTSANTKGAWTELSAATTDDAECLYIYILCGGGDQDVLFDIGTGNNGSEAVLIANVHAIARSTVNATAYYYFFPVAILSGTRVVARYQATATTATAFMMVYLGTDALNIPLTNCTPTTYGAATADSGGTGVDPGAIANTKGAYAEIEDSTANAIDWLTVVVGLRANGAPISARWSIDIATGAASAETVVIADLIQRGTASSLNLSAVALGPFPVTIPAGTRLAARAQCTTTDATDRLIDVTLFGFAGIPAGGARRSLGNMILLS